MAAKEVRRVFDTQQQMIIIDVQDDFGHVTHLQLHFGTDQCPSCQRPYPQDGELKSHDVAQLLGQHLKNVDAHTRHTVREFQKHGADMRALKGKHGPDHSAAGGAVGGSLPAKAHGRKSHK